MNKLKIIERIIELRKRANLSQKALSFSIECNDGYINRLEKKKDFLPSMEVLLKIIEVCGSSAEEFFYREIKNYKTDVVLLDLINDLTQSQKEHFIGFLKKK